MSLDDLKQSDIQRLAELLSRSQQSRERKALCIEFGIEYNRLNFIGENISERDFFLRLIFHLRETGNKDALCKLCSKQALPDLLYQQNRDNLEDIIKKLGCDKSTNIQNSIRIFQKKIFLFISTFFLIVLTAIVFSIYNHKSPPPTITIRNSPAIALFNDNLYIAFQANDTLNQLKITSLGNENSPVTIGSTNIKRGDDPAMAVFNQKLYIAFRINDPSNQLFIASSDKDGTFSTSAIDYPDIQMGGNPAMAVFKNKLYIAFKANDPSNQLFVASSDEDGRFSTSAIGYPYIQMGGNPTMTAIKYRLYIAFKANDPSNQLFVASSDKDGTFSTSAIGYPGIEMDSDPAMAVFKNKLYIAFKANDPSNRLCIVSSELELSTFTTCP